MKILCCVKQVPEKDARVRISSDGSWIVEEGEDLLGKDRVHLSVQPALEQYRNGLEAEVVAGVYLERDPGRQVCGVARRED